MKKLLLGLLFLTGLASAQIFPQAASSIRKGASTPATCRDSQVFFVNNTGMYQCIAGVWTVVPTSGGGGSGTVTVVGAGSLTSTALVTGGGSQTIQTPSATATLDSSGNILTPGSISTGVGSGVSGFWQCTQGTAHTADANSSGFQCPTSVTSAFMFTLPGAPALGLLHATNATPSVLSTSLVVAADITTATITPAKMSASTFDAQTDGATVTWAIGSVLNAQASLLFTVHSGSRTLNITNPVIGGNYVLRLTQDSTGGEGLILGTGCTWKVINSGAGAVTLSTGASAVDILTFTYDGSSCLATIGKAFS